MTFLSVGFVVGSFMYGVVCNHVDKYIVQFLALTLAAIVLAAIPWCRIHVAMVTGHAIVGFCNGIIDSVVNAEMLAVWGNGGRSFMQAMYFSDSIGGVISPIVTAQFLSFRKLYQHNMPDHSTANDGNNATLITMPTTDLYIEHTNTLNKSGTFLFNVTERDLHMPISFYHSSQLYIAYIISACVCIFVAMAFLLMFFTFNRDIYSDRAVTEMTSSKNISKYRKIIILINMGLMACIYTAIEESFSGFLPAFCISQLNWSMSNASYVLSVFYSCIGLGRLVGVFWASYLNPKNILGVLCLLISVTLTIILWCGLHHSDIGIWLSVAFIGFFFAVILPTVFTWTEEDFFPVTGHISSYLNIAANCGATINPVVIGTLMENCSPMWFTYIFLIESFVLLMTYVIGILLSRHNRANQNENAYQEMK
ncbi:Sodium-dependent glucose transporter 1A [Mizuhopecten yessoensis]|uniref:Sodium-dependent glucose transporter 1A n=1 Tax=Mizuhopecten yessoensis TaxID=6573 RepID=A0A210PXZ2_MIZYE|nr:Sodium-dependent glucose transporter 1A [Mizuhopecten yessoensis]